MVCCSRFPFSAGLGRFQPLTPEREIALPTRGVRLAHLHVWQNFRSWSACEGTSYGLDRRFERPPMFSSDLRANGRLKGAEPSPKSRCTDDPKGSKAGQANVCCRRLMTSLERLTVEMLSREGRPYAFAGCVARGCVGRRLDLNSQRAPERTSGFRTPTMRTEHPLLPQSGSSGSAHRTVRMGGLQKWALAEQISGIWERRDRTE